eukprot:6899363-Pyramimonas_sp.AAC.2
MLGAKGSSDRMTSEIRCRSWWLTCDVGAGASKSHGSGSGAQFHTGAPAGGQSMPGISERPA